MIEYGVHVELKTQFLVVRETLERMGICNQRTKVITPSAYILHKKGKYYIIHFKCLLAADGFKKEIDEKDILRQNAIATMLENWSMVKIIEDGIYQEPLKEKIFILPFSEKEKYTINHKYRMNPIK